MKHRCLCKGIITLCLLLCFSILLPLSLEPATAYAAEAEIKLNVKTKSIVKGKDYALKVYNLTENQTVSFKSSAPDIASVDENGLVTAVSVGTAVITVSVTDSVAKTVTTLQCDITVGPPAINVQFSTLEYELVLGQRVFIEKILLPLNTVEEAKFSSYDKEIAAVSAGGCITAKGIGYTYVFAQIDNGRFAVCKVTVNEAEAATDDAALTPAPLAEEADSEEASAKTATTDPLLKAASQLDFETFLKRLNANFANGDNASENTDNTATVTPTP